MQKIFPFLHWFTKYQKSDFNADLIAGLTVGIVLIPQAMAYAMIAGLPPVYGLYASIFPLLIYVFLGTSKHLGIGPVAIDSLLVAAGLGVLVTPNLESYIAMAIFLAFMVGVIQLLLGVFRMGFLVNFLSKPVISGFTSAAALIIIFSQLKHLLGTQIERSSKFHELIGFAIERIATANLADFAIGFIGVIALVALKKWSKKIPGILIVVLLSIAIVYFFNLEEYQVKVIGTIPTGLPTFQIPDFQFEQLMKMWPIALTLALVGYLEAISIGKALQEKEGNGAIDANQELVALGASNIVGSFFQSYGATASFSRSAINYESGVRTNLAALFTVALVIVTLLFLTPIFYYLPNAILASVIMVSVFNLIDFRYVKHLWMYRKDEFAVLMITFLVTLFVGIPQGILSGVLFSLLLMVYRSSKPHYAILGNIEGTPYYRNIMRFSNDIKHRDDLLIIRFDAQLYFGNAGFFKKQLFKEIDKKGETLQAVILNAEAINYIDSSATQMLIRVLRELEVRKIKFFIAGAIGPTRDIIFRSGIIDELKQEHIFVNTKEAVAYFDDPNCISDLQEKVAKQYHTKGD